VTDEKEKKRVYRQLFVKERRTTPQRRWLYRVLRQHGLQPNQARQARDFTTGHIQRIHGLTINKIKWCKRKKRK